MASPMKKVERLVARKRKFKDQQENDNEIEEELHYQSKTRGQKKRGRTRQEKTRENIVQRFCELS